MQLQNSGSKIEYDHNRFLDFGLEPKYSHWKVSAYFRICQQERICSIWKKKSEVQNLMDWDLIELVFKVE